MWRGGQNPLLLRSQAPLTSASKNQKNPKTSLQREDGHTSTRTSRHQEGGHPTPRFLLTTSTERGTTSVRASHPRTDANTHTHTHTHTHNGRALAKAERVKGPSLAATVQLRFAVCFEVCTSNRCDTVYNLTREGGAGDEPRKSRHLYATGARRSHHTLAPAVGGVVRSITITDAEQRLTGSSCRQAPLP